MQRASILGNMKKIRIRTVFLSGIALSVILQPQAWPQAGTCALKTPQNHFTSSCLDPNGSCGTIPGAKCMNVKHNLSHYSCNCIDPNGGIDPGGEPGTDWPDTTVAVLSTPDITEFTGAVAGVNLLNAGTTKSQDEFVFLEDETGNSVSSTSVGPIAPGATASIVLTSPVTIGTVVVLFDAANQIYPSFNVQNPGTTTGSNQWLTVQFKTFKDTQFSPLEFGAPVGPTAKARMPNLPGTTGPLQILGSSQTFLVSNHDPTTAGTTTIWVKNPDGTLAFSQTLTTPAGQTSSASLSLTPGDYVLGICPNTSVSADLVDSVSPTLTFQWSDSNFVSTGKMNLTNIPGCP